MKYAKNLDESTVENYLVRCVKALRGIAIKLRFLRGWPDRIVLLPGAKIAFVELKRPTGGRYEPLQLRVHAQIRRMGFVVYTCFNKYEVDAVLNNMVNPDADDL